MPLSDKLKPVGFGAGVGTFFGGIAGFVLGGPSLAVKGAQTGFMLGSQTGLAIKVDEGLDATGKKVMQGIDNAGRKVEVIADKTATAIEKAGDVAADSIRNVIDVWSKIYLSGTAMKFALDTLDSTLNLSNKHCVTAWESLNCATISMTTISAGTAVGMIVLAVGIKAFNLIRK